MFANCTYFCRESSKAWKMTVVGIECDDATSVFSPGFFEGVVGGWGRH